jgi:hypothetical protein
VTGWDQSYFVNVVSSHFVDVVISVDVVTMMKLLQGSERHPADVDLPVVIQQDVSRSRICIHDTAQLTASLAQQQPAVQAGHRLGLYTQEILSS